MLDVARPPLDLGAGHRGAFTFLTSPGGHRPRRAPPTLKDPSTKQRHAIRLQATGIPGCSVPRRPGRQQTGVRTGVLASSGLCSEAHWQAQIASAESDSGPWYRNHDDMTQSLMLADQPAWGVGTIASAAGRLPTKPRLVHSTCSKEPAEHDPGSPGRYLP
jgi:hypothetical protein